MFGTIVLALVMPVAPASMSMTALMQDNPPIQVWLNKDDNVDFGERVKVFVRSEYDGHMIVLHSDPEGRVRVLYPLDPGGDGFIRGGSTYEVDGRQDGHSFRAVDTPGIGTIYVAYSQDPFEYGEFVLNGHWDFSTDYNYIV